MAVNRYTEEDDKRIVEFWSGGFAASEIASELRRSTGAIKQRLLRLSKQGRLQKPQSPRTKTMNVEAGKAPMTFAEYPPDTAKRVPMIALVGSREEITETLKNLFS